ncbi:hypothetical protein [Paenibacillus periandrae]|uniref:hypothetical protein n=1 Tax=Paenibacillus periandrae TaxID=1761741 RepID=UPI001F090FF7|nr:hypothetical protein [Paenibacillus periandrae]
MEAVLSKQTTHDNRKIYPQVYAVKPGPVQILQIPKLQYVSQEMNTAFHMNWAGHPEPLDEQWIVWKIGLWCKALIHDNIIEMKSWDGATYFGSEIEFI